MFDFATDQFHVESEGWHPNFSDPFPEEMTAVRAPALGATPPHVQPYPHMQPYPHAYPHAYPHMQSSVHPGVNAYAYPHAYSGGPAYSHARPHTEHACAIARSENIIVLTMFIMLICLVNMMFQIHNLKAELVHMRTRMHDAVIA